MAEQGHFKIDKFSISFGGLKAVSNFCLDIPPRALYGLIGPNGAGKTTIFNLITGVYVPDSGTMHLGEQSLVGCQPYEIAKAGISRTFQNIRIFKHLTVLENVLVSFHMSRPYGYLATLLRTPTYLAKEKEMRDESISLLELFHLGGRKDEVASSLSYGDQRRLEIARALATRPKVLLLDEPAAGLNSGEKVQLMHQVSDIRNRFNVSVLLIEHDMKLVMGICERISVLDHGEVIAEGLPKQIQENPKVIEAYLGVAE